MIETTDINNAAEEEDIINEIRNVLNRHNSVNYVLLDRKHRKKESSLAAGSSGRRARTAA